MTGCMNRWDEPDLEHLLQCVAALHVKYQLGFIESHAVLPGELVGGRGGGGVSDAGSIVAQGGLRGRGSILGTDVDGQEEEGEGTHSWQPACRPRRRLSRECGCR